MIISRTPYRISFLGGGTDYPTWFKENGGAVLSTTIDKYCYISVRNLPPFFEHKHRIVYSQIEDVTDIKEIRHPAVRAILTSMEQEDGLEVHHDGDLPARSGIGSSSAFTVGLINGIKALRGEAVSKKELASHAIHLEQNVLKEAVGSQDQVAVAYGGLNKVDFHRDGTFDVSPVITSLERRNEMQSHLMLFFTGFSRYSTEVAQTKIENFKNREDQLKTMRNMVDDGLSVLQNPKVSITEFGKLLHESWLLKRSLSEKVSTNSIDEIYQAGMSAGALGGKLIGAGGGGFILFFARPEDQPRIREKLSRLVYVSIRFETEGSRIVFYDPQISPMQSHVVKNPLRSARSFELET